MEMNNDDRVLDSFSFFFKLGKFIHILVHFPIVVPFIIPLKKITSVQRVKKNTAVVKAGENGEKFGKNCARLSMLSSFSSYRGIYEQRSRMLS